MLLLLSFLLGLLLPNLYGFFSRLVRKEEPYNLDHLLLNVQPETCSTWLNMGYWKDTVDFPRACEALALKLASFGGLRQNCRIKEVGYGCGDSLLLWANRFSPALLDGVTSLSTQRDIAIEKLRGYGVESKVKGDVRCGDACADGGEGKQYDFIIALDCVYHFPSRFKFLQLSHSQLADNGTLLLTDLVPVPPTSSNPLTHLFTITLHRLICLLSSVPYSNLLPMNEYIAEFKRAGYEVEVEDLTEYVFGGLRSFIERRDKQKRFEPFKGGPWAGFVGFAKVLQWWEGGRMKFILVKATKQDR
ncbi:S-adenosyl-L-methionine-dependent methyltransferase [Atractiella rhizophila]|nr:S-adenosyl-L-methionine-dependent methyltransferase [Atractiella rhizophila]